MKKFTLFFLLLLALGSFKAYKKYAKRPIKITPYPFHISENYGHQRKIVERASILILGDRMGKALNAYIPSMVKDLSINLAEVIKIFNWSQENEGIHRTLARLKSLKNFPEIIIYHGASEEFFEQTFHLKDKSIIFENFKKHGDDGILSLIMAFPFLSKFIYKPVDYLNLENVKKTEERPKGTHKLIQMEMIYKLYQYQLEEMINLIKENNSTLILLTTPINLSVPPNKVCKGSSNALLRLELEKIEKELKNGLHELSFQKLEFLKKKVFGNARVLYLSGISSQKLGYFKTAEKILQQSAVFDCGTWRGNKVFNNLIRQSSNKHDLFLIDFDKMVNSNLGKDNLFIGKYFPQTVFYKKVIEAINQIIVQTLEL